MVVSVLSHGSRASGSIWDVVQLVCVIWIDDHAGKLPDAALYDPQEFGVLGGDLSLSVLSAIIHWRKSSEPPRVDPVMV